MSRLTFVAKSIDLKKWTNRLVALYPQISRVYLVGSRAKGTSHAKSDYDIILCVDSAKSLSDLSKMGVMDAQYDKRVVVNSSIDIFWHLDNGKVFARNTNSGFRYLPSTTPEIGGECVVLK